MSLIRREHATNWPTEMNWPDERIDRAFREMFRDFFSGAAFMDRFAEGWTKPIQVEEYVEDGTCVIRAELAGIDPDKDVEISINEGVLLLRAHREERKEEERPDSYHSEFRYGSFQRTIHLPEGANESDVKASYRDGILEVRVPVQSAVKPATRIPVEHG